MIKILNGQLEVEAKCPYRDKYVQCSQNVNKNLPDKPLFGKKLCLESDECSIAECEYHNKHQVG